MRSPWHHSVQVPVYIINIHTRQASNPVTSAPGPVTVALSPFAVDPPSALRQLDVRVVRPVPARLVLEYELLGDLARVRIAAADQGDDLWRHTCMEVFVTSTPVGPYLEFNLAPDGRWAAYRFSGLAPLTGIRPPRIELRTQSDRLLLSADVALPADLAAGGLQLGISAVVENVDGKLEYWALRHAGPKPDFHHPDSFGFEI